MAAISFFSLENDLSEFNYSEAMWGYSLCSFEVTPGKFNIHVADRNDEIVASGSHEGDFKSMLIMLLAAFYNVAARTKYSDFDEVCDKMPYHEWLILNIEPKVSLGIPKQFLMTPDKVWNLYVNEMYPPQPKTWRQKIQDGEVRPCMDDFKTVENPRIGNLYHLSWADGGAVWRLLSIDGENCMMVTPKTGKERIAKVKDLRMTRGEQSKGTTRSRR